MLLLVISILDSILQNCDLSDDDDINRQQWLIQRPVHQSFGLVKCTVGLVGLAKKMVYLVMVVIVSHFT